MKIKLSKVAKILALPLAITMSSAQEVSEDDAILVIGDAPLSNQATASKTDTPLIDVPNTINVITQEQITDQAIDSIGQVVDYTPGVTNSQGEGHRDSVVFRGQDRGTANFFVDGVRDDVQYFRSLYNLEQVEVLLGANALFFGRGSAGGAINRVTKKAQIGENFTTYKAGIDTFGQTDASFDYNYSPDDKTAFRLNIFNENLANHRSLFDGQRIGINPTGRYKISEDTVIDFSYEYVNHERFIDRGIPSLNGAPADSLSDITFGDEDLNSTETLGHIFNVTLNHNINENWKARGTVSYSDFDKVYQNFFPTEFDGTNVTIDGYIDSTDRQRFSLYGDLVGEFTTGTIDHKLLFGVEYINTQSDQNRFNAEFSPDDNADSDTEIFNASNFNLTGGGGVNTSGNFTIASFTNASLNDDTEVSIDAASFFLQDEIALNKHVDLVLGARFDSFNIEVVDNEPGSSNGGQNVDEQVSPRFGLVVKPIEDLSLYASYSETFQPRSGDQFTDLSSGSGDNLDANEFSNLEVGVKWNINPNLLFTASAYQIEQDSLDEIDATDVFQAIETTTNGFELSLKGHITDNWYTSFGYAYLDGEGVTAEGDGFTPREQAQNTFSFWNRYQFNEKFGLGLGVIYQSESFADIDNSVELPSYVRVDASAYYTFNDSFSVQLNIENLFDKDYFPSAHTNNNITVGAPINARIGVVGRF